MTAQVADQLINECPDICLEDLLLYGVVTGDIDKNHGWGLPYTFAAKANPNLELVFTACWRGYRSIYKLDAAGQLVLEAFDYFFDEGRPPDPVGEAMVGNFWLVLKPSFFGPRVYLPFRDGVAVSDRAQWVFEARGPSRPVTGVDGTEVAR